MGGLVAQHALDPSEAQLRPEVLHRHSDLPVEDATRPVAEARHLVEARGVVEDHLDPPFPGLHGPATESLPELLVGVFEQHLETVHSIGEALSRAVVAKSEVEGRLDHEVSLLVSNPPVALQQRLDQRAPLVLDPPQRGRVVVVGSVRAALPAGLRAPQVRLPEVGPEGRHVGPRRGRLLEERHGLVQTPRLERRDGLIVQVVGAFVGGLGLARRVGT